MRLKLAFLAAFALMTLVPSTAESSPRIKDIAFVSGVRSNQLVGYGLVAGLDGTGDGRRIPFTQQMLANLTNQFGVTFDPRQLRSEDVATVMITAELPPYAKEGAHIDVVVSAIGDAESLQGGTLLLTPLRGADNQIYALAQGPVSIGGFEAGRRRTGQEKHLTTGFVPGGAIVEREVPSTIFVGENRLILNLMRADFSTAARVADAINLHFHQICAEAVDGASISVRIPSKYADDRITFISEMETIPVRPDVRAQVVINERTGTVVVGQEVVISPVAVSHGDLRIVIGSPATDPGAGSPTTEGHVAEIEGANVGEVAAALNALGILPQDMIAIFQAIERAGALQAKLDLM
ncbi:MAG: flagellar basal body P-ring protein FlgI [Candidatus Abyssubacteria bacterium]